MVDASLVPPVRGRSPRRPGVLGEHRARQAPVDQLARKAVVTVPARETVRPALREMDHDGLLGALPVFPWTARRVEQPVSNATSAHDG